MNTRSALARDITLMLIIKAIALYLIWLAWFSGPQDKNLDADKVGKTLITSPATHKEANHAQDKIRFDEPACFALGEDRVDRGNREQPWNQ